MSTPPAAKRSRLSSSTPSIPASRAVQDAITALASSSSELPPTLYSRLLGSLSNAHARTLEQEQDTLAIKAESDEVREEEAAAPNPPLVHSTLSRSWLATIQGELTELEKMILHDIEAATPKLDELGILVRPYCAEGKIDLRKWTFAIPGKAGGEWDGCLFKGFLTFQTHSGRDYPKIPPKVQTVPPLFHPNLFPSGTFCYKFESKGDLLEWPSEGYKQGGPFREWEENFPALAPELRLPMLLHGCRRVVHFPNFDDPAQLDAYQLGKKNPSGYLERQKEEAKKHRPNYQDLLDLAEAQKRVEQRKREQ